MKKALAAYVLGWLCILPSLKEFKWLLMDIRDVRPPGSAYEFRDIVLPCIAGMMVLHILSFLFVMKSDSRHFPHDGLLLIADLLSTPLFIAFTLAIYHLS